MDFEPGKWKKTLVAAERVMDCFTVFLFTVVFGTVLAQVVMRFVFDSPLIWSEELCRYAFIWLCFIGWIYATRNGSHIRIGLFLEALPGGARRAVERFNAAATVVFSLALSWYGGKKVLMSFDSPTVTLAFLNFGIIYAILPIANVVVCLYVWGGLMRKAQEGTDAP